MAINLSAIIAWCLRLAIYGLVTIVALFAAGVAVMCGVPHGVVFYAYIIGAPVTGVIIAECAVRPMRLSFVVSRCRLKRAVMSAIGRARAAARLRPS
jgi:hypothetical protein